MTKVYIAGKLNDDACNYIVNCHNMIKEARKVRSLGCAVYVPCLDFLEGLMAGNFEYEDYFQNSQEFLKCCDALYVCPKKWEESSGTKREIALAKSLGMPVYYRLGDLLDAVHSEKSKKKS